MKQHSLYQIETPIQFYPRGKEKLVEEHFTYQTKHITFSIHYRHKLVSKERLKEFLVSDKDSLCVGRIPCSNYRSCWSCPPYAPNLDKYSQNYNYGLVYCFWTDWNFKINSTNPYFKLLNANRTLSPLAWHYGQKLERILGGKDAIDGRCPICRTCEKVHNRPCKYPKQRRSSMEAIGLDATLISQEILNHKIEWYRKVNDKIIEPRYLTVIHTLFTNSLQPKEMIK